MAGAKRFSALGSYSPLVCSWAQKGIHQVGIAGAVAVAQQVGGLVQHRNVFVLIDHLDRRLAARRLFGRDHRLFGEELIVEYTARSHHRSQPVPLTALAVTLMRLCRNFMQQV